MAEPRNLLLFLTADGVAPFKKHSLAKGGYSLYSIACGFLNFPPHPRRLMPLIHVLGVAPGPSHHRLQSYLAPLADELAYQLEHGRQVVDASKDPTDPAFEFDCKVMLVIVTADLRAIVRGQRR